MNCPKCGVEISPKQVLCIKCGYPIKQHNKKKSFSRGCLIALGVSFLIIVLFAVLVFMFARNIFFGISESVNVMNALSNIQNISESEAKYYSQNNKYTADFDHLDVNISNAQIAGNKADTENFVYEIALPYIKAIRKDNSKFKYTFSNNLDTNEITCKGDNSICETFYDTEISITTESDVHGTKYEYHAKYKYNKEITFGDKQTKKETKSNEESLPNTDNE